MRVRCQSPSTPAPAPSLASYYEFFGARVSWDIGEQRCVDWNGHLASVEAPRRGRFSRGWPAVLAIADEDGSGIWLGGNHAALMVIFEGGTVEHWSSTTGGPEQLDTAPVSIASRSTTMCRRLGSTALHRPAARRLRAITLTEGCAAERPGLPRGPLDSPFPARLLL
jgi:hypothetical protein